MDSFENYNSFTSYLLPKISLPKLLRWIVGHDRSDSASFKGMYAHARRFQSYNFFSACKKKQSTNVLFDQVYPTGCHVTFRRHKTRAIGQFNTLFTIIMHSWYKTLHFAYVFINLYSFISQTLPFASSQIRIDFNGQGDSWSSADAVSIQGSLSILEWWEFFL